MVLQFGFIWSYAGAFHHPAPHRVPVAVVAPARAAGATVAKLNALPAAPLRARPAASEAAALTQLRRDEVAAVLLVSPAGSRDTVLLAGGDGAALADATAQVLTRAEASQHRATVVHDAVPLQAGDARGLTGFYLVIGWLVGGYLAAALLGMARGSRPAGGRQAALRLAALAGYAAVSGLGGALIVGPLLGALTGHLAVLWGIGALVVFSAAAVTVAFQALAGVLGIGLSVLLFVVLGNPSAGGAYPPALLPPFWRAISGALPNGAGTDAVRRVVYFGGRGIAGHLLVIAAYGAAGAVAAWLASSRAARSQAASSRAARGQLHRGQARHAAG